MTGCRVCCCALAVLCMCGRSHAADSPAPPPAIRMVDATAESRIAFRHNTGGIGRQYTVEFMAAGLALFDYDNDGLIDIYFPNGAPLPGAAPGKVFNDALYRNNGDGTFTDVTDAAGVSDAGHGQGVVAADYDNDGDQDLYVNNFGRNVLYRNNGDGTFSDVTREAGVDRGERFGSGVCFLDIEADGDLDLYVANYLDFTFAEHAVRVRQSYPYPPGPQSFRPQPDNLFRNNGDGTFTDVSEPSGIGRFAGPSMGAISLDADDDGDSDLFVCNDAKANFFFRNDGRGSFEEAALEAGLAFNFYGHENGSMGADCGDYDNDGRLDLFMTDYTGERPALYRNLGGGLFEDVAGPAGAAQGTVAPTKWGAVLADFDNDGDRDLFIACGHFLENIATIDDRTSYRTRNILLANDGRRFTDVSAAAGDGLAVIESSRGAGSDDLDNDGDLDVAILNSNARPTLLRNETASENHWLQIMLRGTAANRDGVGSHVTVIAEKRLLAAEVHSGRGYQGHFGTRLHFGLGELQRVDRVEVRWLGDDVEVFDVPATDRLIVLVQGSGREVRP